MDDRRLQSRSQASLSENELFTQKSTSYSLRNNDFDIPTFNTINHGKHSLRYQGPHIWLKIDKKLKGSSNIEPFKRTLGKKT